MRAGRRAAEGFGTSPQMLRLHLQILAPRLSPNPTCSRECQFSLLNRDTTLAANPPFSAERTGP